MFGKKDSSNIGAAGAEFSQSQAAQIGSTGIAENGTPELEQSKFDKFFYASG